MDCVYVDNNVGRDHATMHVHPVLAHGLMTIEEAEEYIDALPDKPGLQLKSSVVRRYILCVFVCCLVFVVWRVLCVVSCLFSC